MSSHQCRSRINYILYKEAFHNQKFPTTHQNIYTPYNSNATCNCEQKGVLGVGLPGGRGAV